MAMHGVLFLDELPEFDRRVLEVLREPLESGRVSISRAARQAEFPAEFQLVGAMNPCPCGFLGHYSNRCRCTPDQMRAIAHGSPVRCSTASTCRSKCPRCPGRSRARRARRIVGRDPRARRARARAAARAAGQAQRAARAAGDGRALHAGRAGGEPARPGDPHARTFRARLSPRAQGRAHDRRSADEARVTASHVAEAIQLSEVRTTEFFGGHRAVANNSSQAIP